MSTDIKICDQDVIMIMVDENTKFRNIKKFNMDTIDKPSTVLIVGPKKCGKKRLAIHLVNRGNCKRSGSNEVGKGFSLLSDEGNCETRSNVTAVCRPDKNKIYEDEGIECIDSSSLRVYIDAALNSLHEHKYLIIDHVLDSKNLSHREILLNGRHYNITVILLAHTTRCLNPTYRLAMDCVFIFNPISNSERAKIASDFCTNLTLSRMIQVLRRFSVGHQVTVIKYVGIRPLIGYYSINLVDQPKTFDPDSLVVKVDNIQIPFAVSIEI